VHTWGPTTSTLTVTNKDGARYPSPRAMLDKLLGKLTFDPLTFATMKPFEQREMLRQLVGLDFTDLEMQKSASTNERTLLNREIKSLTGQLEGLPEYKETVEVDVAALMSDLERANATKSEAERQQVTYAAALAEHKAASANITRNVLEVERLKSQLAGAEAAVRVAEAAEEAALKAAVVVEQARDAAVAAIINPEPIRQAIKDADGINQKVRANKVRGKIFEALLAKKTASENLTVTLDKIEAERRTRLAGAKFPVPGIGLTDDGVTLGNVPLEQASASERLRLSVAVGLALNPKLQVLLIRNGNLLDEDSLKAVAEQAAAADAQVWCEYVTKDAAGMTVMIEEGGVK
jgi:DNA repair exonuclease SbcCD ATPase subunit